MPVNSQHPDYIAFLPAWTRARDVLAGEDAVKAGGTKYLPKLDSQTNEEYHRYKSRASFFNATARTAEGYLGLVFRRPPFIKVPEAPEGKSPSHLHNAFSQFLTDVDLLGTTLNAYAKKVVNEVIAVGRAGTLLDWAEGSENRAYISLYRAEQILNWKVERINGRTIPTMIVLFEGSAVVPGGSDLAPDSEGNSDPFEPFYRDQIRVLKLIPAKATAPQPSDGYMYVAEIWTKVTKASDSPEERDGKKWQLTDTHVPLRLGKPLSAIPFVFHGPRHSLPDVEKLPLADIIAVNLDHYRLDADYKHGMHYTAIPTAWVSGFEKGSHLKIGATHAWVTETPGAKAEYLEFSGQGLTTFERAMDRDERLLAILGSRLLEGQKKVGEAAQAIELRQSGENSILSSLANSVSQSLTRLLQWVYWWNSTSASPDEIGASKVTMELNTDFSTTTMDPQEIQAIITAWQAGAISRETMTDLFRRGEILPEGRTVEEEIAAIRKQSPAPVQPESPAPASPTQDSSSSTKSSSLMRLIPFLLLIALLHVLHVARPAGSQPRTFLSYSEVFLSVDKSDSRKDPGTADQSPLHCDALQVPILRGSTDEPPAHASLRFIDMPGTDWRDAAAVGELARFQGANFHLVLNAAYHEDILLKQLEALEGLGLKNLIFSHLDEEPRWGRMLSVALRSGHQTSYLSAGQNVPGNFHPAGWRQFLPPKRSILPREEQVANVLLNNGAVSSLWDG